MIGAVGAAYGYRRGEHFVRTEEHSGRIVFAVYVVTLRPRYSKGTSGCVAIFGSLVMAKRWCAERNKSLNATSAGDAASLRG